MRTYDDAISVLAVGTTVVSSGASASLTVPNAGSGVKARYVRLTVTGLLYVKITAGAGTCTTNDMLINPNTSPIINVIGCDTISYLQETAAAKLNVVPLEG